jgi:hypothetical protein
MDARGGGAVGAAALTRRAGKVDQREWDDGHGWLLGRRVIKRFSAGWKNLLSLPRPSLPVESAERRPIKRSGLRHLARHIGDSFLAFAPPATSGATLAARIDCCVDLGSAHAGRRYWYVSLG